MAAGQVVDVLPDRTSETFAAWLREHPGAVEVADRWNLLQSLAVAVGKTCHQHRACLRKRIDEVTSRIPEAAPLMQLPLHGSARALMRARRSRGASITSGSTPSAVLVTAAGVSDNVGGTPALGRGTDLRPAHDHFR
ncbi:hypothetical protein [Streptomyces sp. NPDC059874]|uniref:hypothetical protein n=1 Tax=Streptomyces sp. NPDC059874 TaxID=3346983 RepID=UPI0036629625